MKNSKTKKDITLIYIISYIFGIFLIASLGGYVLYPKMDFLFKIYIGIIFIGAVIGIGATILILKHEEENN
ncbi:hypothetical protein HN832_03420 [archaeon]|jgi:hypothetical protein|nr:hypothetical protein [archaeon]MBT4373554.1 hypothetical protein [archaeon]MBT4532002.1 hypothetical protein [archaeon]MBT7001669.1 hypothetical protein [archaeon]MBT7282439.1 hypothetical protein [archaeon]